MAKDMKNTGTGMTVHNMLGRQGQLQTSGYKSEVPDKKGVSGVYGANPSFPNYPQSIGKDTLPTKFAESPITVPTVNNKMKTVNGPATAKMLSIAKPQTISTKNKYNKVGMMTTGMKIPVKGK